MVRLVFYGPLTAAMIVTHLDAYNQDSLKTPYFQVREVSGPDESLELEADDAKAFFHLGRFIGQMEGGPQS